MLSYEAWAGRSRCVSGSMSSHEAWAGKSRSGDEERVSNFRVVRRALHHMTTAMTVGSGAGTSTGMVILVLELGLVLASRSPGRRKDVLSVYKITLLRET
ncbi:hypothetical protein RRG08_045061 [Elysia crispata]|uniref:Uncharacterized protein n=1 Tax=Elysia crispata TaxID=231223 RepID=A0AAE0XUP7_9GAST|nr:hypothetical protein RRG08_045061 [Elysia crispata]